MGGKLGEISAAREDKLGLISGLRPAENVHQSLGMNLSSSLARSPAEAVMNTVPDICLMMMYCRNARHVLMKSHLSSSRI